MANKVSESRPAAKGPRRTFLGKRTATATAGKKNFYSAVKKDQKVRLEVTVERGELVKKAKAPVGVKRHYTAHIGAALSATSASPKAQLKKITNDLDRLTANANRMLALLS